MTKVRHICSTIILLLAAASTQAQTEYFPRNTLDIHSEFLTEWYSTQLISLKEPSLLELARDSSTYSYRFLWLRSFRNPIAIRLNVNPDGTGTLIQKMTSGDSGFRLGYLTVSTSKPLSQKQTTDFLQKIQQVQFWSIPAIDPKSGGEDGSEWVIEGVKNGKYHVVNRWTPSSGPVRELGLALAIELAGMKIPSNELF